MARIRILSCSHDQNIPLTLPPKPAFILPVKGDGSEDGASNVPDEYLPLLRDSSIEFELVGPAPTEGEEGARGDTSDLPPEVPKPKTPRKRKPAKTPSNKEIRAGLGAITVPKQPKKT